jgi:hypothetical protein
MSESDHIVPIGSTGAVVRLTMPVSLKNRHVTFVGTTADEQPWVITLHPDGTASSSIPLDGGRTKQELSHDAARHLIGWLPIVRMDDVNVDIAWEINKIKRVYPLKRRSAT